MNQRMQFLSKVSETLLIPLYIRAMESKKKNAMLKDPMAERLIEKIDYDFCSLDSYLDSGSCCIIRAKYYDSNILRSAQNYTSTVVVNIGCGLDTRHLRIPDEKITFYELDLPDVIEFRRKLMPEEDKRYQITKSMFDTTWLDTLRWRHSDSHFIFVFEGVLMYFTKEQVRFILNNIADRFPNGEIFFDMCNKASLKTNFGLLRNFKSRFKMALNSGHEIEFLVRKLRLKDQRQYINEIPIGSQNMDYWSLLQFNITQ